jgi:tyrosinase
MDRFFQTVRKAIITREIVMTKLSRRHLVAGGLAGAGASVLPGFTREAHAAPVTRYNLMSANGQAMLKQYAKAVKIMMGLPKSSPQSWTFQWYTHAVPTNTTKAAELAAIFPSPSPAKTLATAMWDTCQGHFNPATQEPYFCPWHRMYLCYFEAIIRRVLNDPKFTLPYWDYTVPSGYRIPKEFRMQTDPFWGPLFRPDRKAVVNAGQPIFNGIPGGVASDLSAAPALAETSYLPVGAVDGFNQTLDFGLHGNIHVYVGNNVGMGRVPWAANDPVFWVHHCNIDRIWASWNDAGHANPGTATWLNKSFTFANPGGQGEKAIVKDYTNTKKCNYVYDKLIASPKLVAAAKTPAAIAAAAPAAPLAVAKTQSGPIALSGAPVRVAVPAAAPSPGAAAPSVAPLSAKLSALPDDRRLYLVLRNIKADAPPEAVYRVYLDLPEGGAPADPINSSYVGSFNFFAAVPHGDDHAGHGGIMSRSFDITDVAANLDAQGKLKAEHSVTIVPSNEPAADSKPVVGEISFVEQ